MKQTHPFYLLGVRPWESPLLSRSIASIARNHQELQLFYRIDPTLTLLQSGSCHENISPKGQIMAMDCSTSQPQGSPKEMEQLLRHILTQCQRQGYGGIATFFPYTPHPSPLKELTTRLDEEANKHHLLYYTTEEYAPFTRHSKIFLSTALSGGSLEERFAQAIHRYSPQRILMDLEPMGVDFLLPSPKGTGIPRTREEIALQIAQENPFVFFSRELCAKYFTHQHTENSLRFLLFDDETTLNEKIKRAKQWNLYGVSLTWSQVMDFSLFH